MNRKATYGLAAMLAVLAIGVAFAAPAVERLLTIFKAGIKIGASGTTISASYAGSADYDFPALSGPGTALNTVCADSDAITVTGAALGDVCTVGRTIAPSGNGTGDFASITCFVSATNAAKVRACASGITDGGTVNLADAGYRVRVFQN